MPTFRPITKHKKKKLLEKIGIDSPVQVVVKEGVTKTFPKHEAFKLHDCNRTFICSVCMQHGFTIAEISKMTGKTITVIDKHYINVDEETILLKANKAFMKAI